MTRNKLVVALMLLVLAGCAPKAPNASLILWEQPSPQIAAQAHAREIRGLAYVVAPTGSMEPYLTGGDFIVVDFTVPFEALKAGDLVNYHAHWLPVGSPTVTHMAAEKSGDEWIMDGIANRHYENGALRMTRTDYGGRVVQVYTKRKK